MLVQCRLLPPKRVQATWEGIAGLGGEERTNYPVTLSVDDLAKDFSLIAQMHASIEAIRICEFMHTAVASLASALETSAD